MFSTFFYDLRGAGIPVTLKEYLTLMQALDADLARMSVETFYYLARTALVKDERLLDKFDGVFSRVFKGLDLLSEAVNANIPEDWLRKISEKFLTEEEKRQIEALGGWDEIMKALKKRLKEQEGRHQGGNKWIGTAGTSPFGAYGYNPAGVRIGQNKSQHQRAIKVWDRRDFKDLDGSIELGTRNMKLALRRLRRFAREGAAEELDLDNTIQDTARQGFLDIKMRPERHNTVKVLMFFDVGGSMDWHVRTAEELFSAARSEFKQLEYYYFHNCPYEYVWKNNERRWTEKIPTWDVLHNYGPDYKVIFVGDASMSPYEIAVAGGAVEHMNEEPGSEWLGRITDRFANVVWLNPVPKQHWQWTPSIEMIGRLVNGRMYPLSLNGLEQAIVELMR